MATENQVRLKIKALDRISGVMRKIKSNFPKLNRVVKKTARVFRLVTEKTKMFRKALGKMGQGMKSIGSKMTLGITAPLALAGVGIIRVAANFDTSMRRVGAITETMSKGKVLPAFTQMRDMAKELGSTTEFTASQVADAMGFLGRAGFSTAEIMAALPAVLDTATASGFGLAFSADIMAKTIRQFGLEASEATRVADVLAEISRKTNVDIEMLAETFKQAAPIAVAYGATLEQTAALTGLLGDAGIQASMAGTAMKNMFIRLATPSKAAISFMRQLGIEMTDGAGGMKSVSAIINELGPALASLNKDKQLMVLNELFGLRGIAGAASLMARSFKEGKDPVAAMTTILNNANGASKDMAATMRGGVKGSMDKFRSAVEGLSIAIGDSGILKTFKEWTDNVTDIVTSMTKADKSLLKNAVIVGLFAAAFGPALSAMGSMVVAFALLLPHFITFGILLKTTVIPFMLKYVAGMWAWTSSTIAASGATAGLIAQVALVGLAIASVVLLIDRLIERWDQMTARFETKGFSGALEAFTSDFDFIEAQSATKAFKEKGEIPGLKRFKELRKSDADKKKFDQENEREQKTRFGFDDDREPKKIGLGFVGFDDDQKAKKKEKSVFGEALGFLTKLIKDEKEEKFEKQQKQLIQSRAQIRVDFNNTPRGTKITGSAKEGVDLDIGSVGALQ